MATPIADGEGGSYSLNELESSEASIAASCAPDVSAQRRPLQCTEPSNRAKIHVKALLPSPHPPPPLSKNVHIYILAELATSGLSVNHLFLIFKRRVITDACTDVELTPSLSLPEIVAHNLQANA